MTTKNTYIILVIILAIASNALAQTGYNPALPPSSTNYVEGDIYYKQTLADGKQIGIIFDIEGNEYPVAMLHDNIWWTTWNIRSITYSDGVRINNGVPSVTTDVGVVQFGYPSSTVAITKTKYWDRSQGLLYNYKAAVNTDVAVNVDEGNTALGFRQGICPTGWHVPSKLEYHAFVDGLGAASGTLVKSATRLAGSTYPDPVGTSNSPDLGGFNMLLTGAGHNSYGGNKGYGRSGYFWTSSANELKAWYWATAQYNTFFVPYAETRDFLMSVRCIKD